MTKFAYQNKNKILFVPLSPIRRSLQNDERRNGAVSYTSHRCTNTMTERTLAIGNLTNEKYTRMKNSSYK